MLRRLVNQNGQRKLEIFRLKTKFCQNCICLGILHFENISIRLKLERTIKILTLKNSFEPFHT